MILLAACCCIFGGQLLGDSQTAILKIDPKIVANGEDPGRPPDGWTRFEWKEKRVVLFEHFAPSENEKQLVLSALPNTPQVTSKKQRKLLVFYRCQYPHVSIATGTFCFEKLGPASGAYDVVLSDDPADFTEENLKRFDAVLLNNTTNWNKTLGPDGCEALVNFVKNGGGLVGIHAASDANVGYREGMDMIGGIFRCHPWLPQGTWAFQLEQPKHPLNKVFGEKGFWERDEIYLYREGTFSRNRSSVLISLDMSCDENCTSKHLHKNERKLAVKDGDFPVAWAHRFGKGRVFYSNFGHNKMTYWSPQIVRHYLAGIQYALGDLEAEVIPSAKLGEKKLAPAPVKSSELP